MVQISIKSLALPDVKILRYPRFHDMRGYFSEVWNNDWLQNEDLKILLQGTTFVQSNESFSKAGVFRGLHFQCDPYVGKLVRALHGSLYDFALDIRLSSPTFGAIIAYELKVDEGSDFGEWIWLPPGFAHGVFFTADSKIQYLCTGKYNPVGEGCISPFAEDIDWSLCDMEVKKLYDESIVTSNLITDKDRNGLSLAKWRVSDMADQYYKNSDI